MSKNTRRLAHERARQVVARQRQAEARRRRILIAGVAVGVVVLLVGVLVVVKLAGSGSSTPTGTPGGVASATVVNGVTTVPPAVLDQVGAGSVTTLPKALTGQPVLTVDGKPLVLYVGAEYCPFCAAERWGAVVALARFGTFSNLGQSTSSARDVFPSTPTLSFHGSTYTSQYLTFQGVETETNVAKGNAYTPLDTLTPQQQQLLAKYNAPPFVASDSAGSIPFIDFANQVVMSGASFSPQVLAGLSHEQIATALADPNSPVAKAINGTANAMTTVLCQLTNNQPAAVCTSTAATAYKGKISAK